MQSLLFHPDDYKAEPTLATTHNVKPGDVFEYKPAGSREFAPVECLRITVKEDDGNGIIRTIHGRRWDTQKPVKLTSSRRMGRFWNTGIVPQREIDRRKGEEIRKLAAWAASIELPEQRTGELEGSDNDVYSDNWEALKAALADAGEEEALWATEMEDV